jgi:integrase
VPKELRTSFVSMMSYQGVPIGEIARLAGHASSRTTELVKLTCPVPTNLSYCQRVRAICGFCRLS